MTSETTADRVTTRPRPALFRALGNAEPPELIEVDGRQLARHRVVKHDSWAATAIYQHDEEWIVCKFNRRQPILGLPASWLGWWLASREDRMFRRLADDPNVPAGCGPVTVAGRLARHAVAHRYVAGRTLLESDTVTASAVQELRALLARLRLKGVAYIDLHKRDNILIGDDGKPYLIDFQISIRLPDVWPFSWVLDGLHQIDRYHLLKHISRIRPDLCEEVELEHAAKLPLLIRWHRAIATPLQRARRAFFVRLGVRAGAGEASTELSPDARSDCAVTKRVEVPVTTRMQGVLLPKSN